MTAKTYLDGKVTLCCGDSREVLKQLPDSSIDSVVTDPPYALVSIVKRFANSPRNERTENTKNPYGRTGRGFMGQRWDTGETAFAQEFWAEVLRVLKPGGHVVAFSATRTYHRMACAIEDAGFEIRDQIGWAFGSGFPKSHNLSGDMEGWGTALKPAWEPICLARRPLSGTVAANVAQHGTGAMNIDECRIHAEDAQGGSYTVKRLKPGATLEATGGNWRPDVGVEYHGEMRPGRWPANILHDGSPEVLSAFPVAPGQQGDITGNEPTASGFNGQIYGKFSGRRKFKARRDGEALANRRYADVGATNFAALPGARRNDGGSAARFFYTAKADAEDRLGSKHPTVKPLDLMQYLVRLVTPKGGTVLDPFAGSGTTGEAAWREGMKAVLIEREPEYQADIARRMDLADKPTKRSAVAVTKGNLESHENLPLFKIE